MVYVWGQDPQKICLSLTSRGLSRPLASRLLLVRSAAWVLAVLPRTPSVLVAPSRVLLVAPSRVLLVAFPRTHFVEVPLRTILLWSPIQAVQLLIYFERFHISPGVTVACIIQIDINFILKCGRHRHLINRR